MFELETKLVLEITETRLFGFFFKKIWLDLLFCVGKKSSSCSSYCDSQDDTNNIYHGHSGQCFHNMHIAIQNKCIFRQQAYFKACISSGGTTDNFSQV